MPLSGSDREIQTFAAGRTHHEIRAWATSVRNAAEGEGRAVQKERREATAEGEG